MKMFIVAGYGLHDWWIVKPPNLFHTINAALDRCDELGALLEPGNETQFGVEMVHTGDAPTVKAPVAEDIEFRPSGLVQTCSDADLESAISGAWEGFERCSMVKNSKSDD